MWRCQTRAKRDALSRSTRAHVHQLQPTTNFEKLSKAPYVPVVRGDGGRAVGSLALTTAGAGVHPHRLAGVVPRVGVPH